MKLTSVVQKHFNIFLSSLASLLVFPPHTLLAFLEKAGGLFLSEPGGVPAVM